MSGSTMTVSSFANAFPTATATPGFERVAATYAAVGAVFGEWAGSSAGLGFVMLQAQPALLTARIFAAVLILCALALALYAAVSLAERLLVPWNREAVHA